MTIDNLELIEDPDFCGDTFGKEEMYIMTTDLEQNESKDIVRNDGSTVKLYTPQKYNSNFRTALPRVGTIVKAMGKDCKFKEGQKVLCNHFTFINEKRQSTHFMEQDGELYYRVTQMYIIAGISGDELIPQDEVIICTPVEDKLIETSLELPDQLVDIRRDVAKVAIVPDKYKDQIPVGNYLMLTEGADYLFEFNGKDYTAVELFLGGAAMHSPELDYRPSTLWKHKNDHGKLTENIREN